MAEPLIRALGNKKARQFRVVNRVETHTEIKSLKIKEQITSRFFWEGEKKKFLKINPTKIGNPNNQLNVVSPE